MGSIHISNFNLQKLTGLSTDTLILILLAAVIVLIILMLIQMKNNRFLIRRYKTFMRGSKARNLEGILKEKITNTEKIEEKEEYNSGLIEELLGQYQYSLQKTGLVKYDAFDENNAKLSFAMALLDGQDNGFVINVVHGQNGSYIYVKEVIDGNSAVLLSNEEKEAVRKALKSYENRASGPYKNGR